VAGAQAAAGPEGGAGVSKRCPHNKCQCVPLEDGYYWATSLKYPQWGRVIVQLGRNGHKHRRAYLCWYDSSYDPCDFTDYSERIVEK